MRRSSRNRHRRRARGLSTAGRLQAVVQWRRRLDMVSFVSYCLATSHQGCLPQPVEGATMGRFATILTLLAMAACIPASAAAQGAIAGVVTDTSGAVLPGVTVEAASSALIERVRS